MPAMKNITTILLDMYGVILEESKGYFIPYTFGSFDQAEYDRLTRQFKEEKLFTRAANGEMTSDEFLTQLGFQDPQYHMVNYIDNFLHLDQGFREFAERYSTKYDFVLLSNDVAEWSAWITEHHDLDQYFTHKIVSGDVKCRKPDRRIYEIALERTGKKPKECCFVDNSVKNLLVAAEMGIEPILFNRDQEEYTGTIVNSFAELAEVLDEGEKE
jgi:putative hydrolase of the HAD superfamily